MPGSSLSFLGLMVLIPLFGLYRGLCHGKSRQSQRRCKRLAPAIKRALIYSAVFAIVFEIIPFLGPAPGRETFGSLTHSLNEIAETFIGLFTLCGIPFIIGMLLIPRRSP